MSVTADQSKTQYEASPAAQLVRTVFDKIYLGAGCAAAICIVMILLLTVAQITTRYLGINAVGLTSYAGYMMAASTFLGLPYALMRGAHIRIETISKLLGSGRLYLDLFAFAASMLLAIWFAWFSCGMVLTTYRMNDISTDLDATPLWIPEATMAIGTTLFAVAMIDNFLTLLLSRHYRIRGSSQPH